MTRSETQRFYESVPWRNMAAAAKKRDTWLCVRCRQEGRTVSCDVVHHKVAIKDGGAKLSLDNLESLCREHHESEHGRGPSEEQKEWHGYLNESRRRI